MSKFWVRFRTFLLLWLTVIGPGYLAWRFSLPELLLLSVVSLSWWSSLILEEIESAKIQQSFQEQ